MVSPTNSPVRLRVSPAAASTLAGIFNQWFEASFPRAGRSLSPGPPAAASPALLYNLPPHWVCQPPPCRESSLPWLTVSAPPTSLDECFFFISLVVGLPYRLIFCQFWLFFVFKFVVLLVVRGGTVCLPTPPSWLEV